MLKVHGVIRGFESRAILRHSAWDSLLIGLSLGHAFALWYMPSIPLMAILLWWNSNTISHNFIHLPFFRSDVMNGLYSLYLTLLLGFPQSFWRDRHLAHHRGKGNVRLTRDIMMELAALIALWTVLLARGPAFVLTTYLPAYAAGLLLCYAHGYFEHWKAVTSHYGTAYNLAFFNDGYHAEHHSRPAEHWSRLPAYVRKETRTSRFPAVLRWLEAVNLETLERIAMRSGRVRRALLETHRRAMSRLLTRPDEIRTITIVGGGLFPRSAILLRSLVPEAAITIVDKSAENLEIAKPLLEVDIAIVNAFFDPREHHRADLVVVPLAFAGDRRALYENPPARLVLIHDWIWRRRGESAVVAWWLLKRVNLVKRT